MSDFKMVHAMEKEGNGKDLNHFKLRAECLDDVLLFIHIMPINVWEMKILQMGQLPDVEFEFKTTLTLDEILAILSKQVDSHVMMETLRPFDEYTGER